ncbi:MAG: hypothetical protein Kow0074_10000 [Candidatus Zixiibacteriota bacterium]
MLPPSTAKRVKVLAKRLLRSSWARLAETILERETLIASDDSVYAYSAAIDSIREPIYDIALLGYLLWILPGDPGISTDNSPQNRTNPIFGLGVPKRNLWVRCFRGTPSEVECELQTLVNTPGVRKIEHLDIQPISRQRIVMTAVLLRDGRV